MAKEKMLKGAGIRYRCVSRNTSGNDEGKATKYKNRMKKPARVTSLTVDTRHIKTSHHSVRPRVQSGTLWEDPCFPREMAMEGSSVEGKSYRWMRPKEFCECPTLVDKKPSRYDIVQGSLGNCWMMAILAGLADHEREIAKLLASYQYDPMSSSYDGVFRCKLWYFGRWVDIYVDDYLPVRADPRVPLKYSLIGARSPDPNVLWVALVEKALAKFHGSYKGIEAREREYGWRLLTGGVPTILDEKSLRNRSHQMFLRIKNALDNDCVVTCSRHTSGRLHAYTITGAKTHSIKGDIVRIRNPWGEEHGRIPCLDQPERWTYSGNENADDFLCKEGEFWIRNANYLDFSQFCIGCFRAEYSTEHAETSTVLDHKYTFLGEWNKETAAGPEKCHVFKNPKFQITVPGSGNKEKKVLFELSPRHLDNTGVCVFLYRIIKIKNGDKVLCEAISSDPDQRVFLIRGCPQYKYSLTSGKYLAIPVTHQSQCEMEFCFRVYSNSKIRARYLTTTTCFHCDNIPRDKSKKLTNFSGKWSDLYVDDKNFASVLHKIPQYKVTTSADANIKIGLLQEHKRDDNGIRIGIYEVQPDISLPVSRDFVENSPQRPFYNSPIWRDVQCNSEVKLKADKCYLLLAYPWGSTDDKLYVLTFGYDSKVKIHCRLMKRK